MKTTADNLPARQLKINPYISRFFCHEKINRRAHREHREFLDRMIG